MDLFWWEVLRLRTRFCHISVAGSHKWEQYSEITTRPRRRCYASFSSDSSKDREKRMKRFTWSHFRVAFNLIMKARLGAMLFMWKLVLFVSDWKLVFKHSKNYAWSVAVHNGVQSNSKMVFWYSGATAYLSPPERIYQFLKSNSPRITNPPPVGWGMALLL